METWHLCGHSLQKLKSGGNVILFDGLPLFNAMATEYGLALATLFGFTNDEKAYHAVESIRWWDFEPFVEETDFFFFGYGACWLEFHSIYIL